MENLQVSLAAACAVVVGWAFTASAATHYVATTGNDETGDGSSAKPWRSITHAIQAPATAEGDEILVGGGLYEESVTNNVSAGGKHRLTFKGGYRADWTRDLRNCPTTVKPPVNTVPCWYIENSISNRVSGFVLTGGSHGILPRGSSEPSSLDGLSKFYTIVSQLIVTNNAKCGILICNPKQDNYVKGDPCVVASCVVANNGSYGIQAKFDRVIYHHIVNCTVYGNKGIGINTGYANNRTVIENCVVFSNKTYDVDSGSNGAAGNCGMMMRRSFVGKINTALKYDAAKGILKQRENQPLEGVFHMEPDVAADCSLKADSRCVKAGLDLREHPWLHDQYFIEEDVYGTPWNGEYDIGAVKTTGANQRGFAGSAAVYVEVDGDDAAAGTEEAPVATVEEGLYRTASNGICHVGTGRWTSRASLFLPGQKLVGAGIDKTILKAYADSEPVLVVGESETLVKGLTFQDAPTAIRLEPYLSATTNVTIDGCAFRNCTNGIYRIDGFANKNGEAFIPSIANSYKTGLDLENCVFKDCARGLWYGAYRTTLYKAANCVFFGGEYGIFDDKSVAEGKGHGLPVVHSTFVSNRLWAVYYNVNNYPGNAKHYNNVFKVGQAVNVQGTMDPIVLNHCLFDCDVVLSCTRGGTYRLKDDTNTSFRAFADINVEGTIPGRPNVGSALARVGGSIAGVWGADLAFDLDGAARDPNGIDIGSFTSPETKQILNPKKTYLVNVTAEPEERGVPNPGYGLQTVEEGLQEFSVTNGLVRYDDGAMAYPAGDGLREKLTGYAYTPDGGMATIGQETSFVVDVQSDATCLWSWEHQCQVIVDAGDGGSTVSVNGGVYAPVVTNWGVVGRSLTISFRENTATETFIGWTDGNGGSPSGSTQFVHTVGQPVTFTAKRRLNHFVSTLGSDETGDGSPSKPWRTITHAILSDRTVEGEEIRVAGGLYEESVTNSVTAGGKHRLVFKGGYDGNWRRNLKNCPTIVKPPVNTVPCWYIENSASNRVSGFVFTGGKFGIVALGSAVQPSTSGDVRAIRTVLTQLVVTNNVQSGILICNAADANYVNGDECLIASCLVSGNGTYGIRPHLDAHKYMRVLNCTVFGNKYRGLGSGYSNNRVVAENSVFWDNKNYDVDAETSYGFSMARRCCIGTLNTAIDYNATVGLAASMNGLEISYNANQPLEGVFRWDPDLNADGSLAANSRCVKAGLDLREHPWVGGDEAIGEDLYGTLWNGEYDLGAIKSTGANQRGFGASQDVYVAVDGDDAAAGTAAAPVATLEEGLYRTAAGGTCHLGEGSWTSHASLFLPGQKLVGAGRDRTVLRPFAASEAVLNVGESDTRVSGVTFRDAPLGVQIVPYLSASTNVQIDACAFRNCTNGIFRLDGLKNADGEAVIPALAGSYKLGLDLTGCVFTDCTRGYWFRASRTVLDRVSNCVFASNDYGIYDGVIVQESKGHKRPVVHSTFVSNRTWAVYYSATHRPGGVSHYNNVYKGDKGLYVYAFDPITLDHCLFDCNLNTRWDQTNVAYRKYDSTNTSFSAFADITLDGLMPGRPNAGSALARAGGTIVPVWGEEMAVDIEGEPRDTRRRHIDIGAYRAPTPGLLILVR